MAQTTKPTIATALWDTFDIEGRDAAYASQATHQQWVDEHPPIEAGGRVYGHEDIAPGAVWNDAFRLGFLLGSGRITLADVGVSR